jgi:hypothetical protein
MIAFKYAPNIVLCDEPFDVIADFVSVKAEHEVLVDIQVLGFLYMCVAELSKLPAQFRA